MQARPSFDHPAVNQRDQKEAQDRPSNEDSPTNDQQENDPTTKFNKRVWLILGTLCTLSFMTSLEATVLAPSLEIIASTLHGTTAEILWVGSAYLLPVAVFQPLVGTVSKDLGRKKFLIASIFLFTLGSLICGTSRAIPQLLVGRVIQGIGGGGISALVYVIPADVLTLRQRPIAIMLMQGGWALGAILGPVLGGVLAAPKIWRWVFYMNLPLCGVILPLVLKLMKLKGRTRSWGEEVAQLDYVGILMFLMSTSALLLGITWGGIQFSWSSWQTLFPVCGGIAGLLSAICWERFAAKRPFLLISLFTRLSTASSFRLTNLAFCLAQMSCELYYLAVYFEGVRGLSARMAGLALIPITITVFFGNVVTGSIIHRTGYFRWALWAGWVVTVVSTGLLITFDMHTPIYACILVLLIIGIGHGILVMCLNFSIQSLADTEHAGHAISMCTFLRASGMCCGIAVGSAVLQNELHIYLGSSSQSTSQSALMDISALARHPGLSVAFAGAFNKISEVMTGISASALLLVVFIHCK
ncbi:hypothetical protein N7520_000535 [Penicillium odoratum]|uniref:uncharacterized protein n=1 Tax=Penicillium odoratum TaxID=1167516 RepID=UPI002547DF79|nr:uncharacterized protein N7520_000535 [Penicillium odoratum]KAJ5777289.1 hypothetical protein N7520_000535 [Penicillium odoratum]